MEKGQNTLSFSWYFYLNFLKTHVKGQGLAKGNSKGQSLLQLVSGNPSEGLFEFI